MAFAEIPGHEEIIREIRTLEANHMTDGVHIRLTLTRGDQVTSGMDPRLNQSGATLIVLPEWKAPVYDKTGLTMITSSIRRFPPDCLDPKIHHNNLIQSILAKVEANVAGWLGHMKVRARGIVDTALMLDREGFIAEANGTHVFFGNGRLGDDEPRRRLPGGDHPRQTVLDICEREPIASRIARISQADAYRAEEMFCTGIDG